MSEAEANARRANRWTWACLALAMAGAVASAASFAFMVVTVLAMVAAWACGLWCVSAKGYSMYVGLLGPFVAVALPSLHPIMEEIERRQSNKRSNDDPPE